MTGERSEVQKWSPGGHRGRKGHVPLRGLRRIAMEVKGKGGKPGISFTFEVHWEKRTSEFLLLSDQQVDCLIY